MKRLLLLLIAFSSMLLTACGDSSSRRNDTGIPNFTVTATAGANGSISPASSSVIANGTATFDITPNTGYMIDSVSGCGGSLSNRTYTTGAITEDCTVTASFVADSVLGWNASLVMFTETLSGVSPVDTAPLLSTSAQASATFGETVYTVFLQSNGANVHPYLTRTIGDSVTIWDEDTSSFNTDLSTGDTIGNGMATDATGVPAIAADSAGNIYIVYIQNDGVRNHLYLTRFNVASNDIEAWDGDAGDWSTTLSDADDALDRVDAYLIQPAELASIAINSADDVFITYIQNSDAFLTRYDSSATAIEVWDGNTNSFSVTLDDGDDNEDNIAQLTADANRDVSPVAAGGDVYFATSQNEQDGDDDLRIALSRYNSTSGLIERWDTGTDAFSSNPADGNTDDDFINAVSGSISDDDADNATISYEPNSGHVYVVYEQVIQGVANQTHLLMTRFNGTTVQYWNGDAGVWSTTQSDGDDLADTVSAGTGLKEATAADIVHASNGDLYVAYLLENASNDNNHVHMSRYNTTSDAVEFWDAGLSAWDTDKANGDEDNDAIDDSTVATIVSTELDIAIAANDDVYVAYNQDLQGGTNSHLKLSRYQASTDVMQVWSTNTNSFVTTQTDAGAIDEPTPANVSLAGATPSLVMLPTDALIISYIQTRTDAGFGGSTTHVQLAKVLTSTLQ